VDELVVSCADLDGAIDWFERLGMRIEMTAPADDPEVAVLGNGRARVRIERTGVAPRRVSAPALVVSRADGAWCRGRAGMLYRDLIPGRHGGRFVASHIRIVDAGPVPDYVHFHDVRFQMIYCVRGWVRVVYEGQGEPFVLEPGDCVVQPAQIRHRVLECSPGLEVVELTTPAAHATYADHGHALPDAHRGTPIARTLAAIEPATGGVSRACVLDRAADLAHDADLRFGFVLRGSATLVSDATYELATADAFALPGGVAARIAGDFALLDVRVAATDPR
jgi:quercetin dioxygenase-like cupin family protein